MDHQMSIILAGTTTSVICSAVLLATSATRVYSPIYIAWLTTSTALFFICLCYTIVGYLHSPRLGFKGRVGRLDEQTEHAVLRDNAAAGNGARDPRNAHSLSTFYWCSPNLKQNTGSTSRTPETVIYKPLHSLSGVLSTMQSSPMLPGLPPEAYFDSSRGDLRPASKMNVVQDQEDEVEPPLPTYQRVRD